MKMICNIENCNKEAKNLVKIVGTYFEFQLCDEHFRLIKSESLRSYLLKELNRLKYKDKDSDKKQKELKIKMGKVKIIPQETEPTTASKRRKETMKELMDLWEKAKRE